MANRAPEQELINGFVLALQNHEEVDLRVRRLINTGCRARDRADIEYVSESGVLWAIEAKSNDSKDAHNTVHKIFGELLKETGRQRNQDSVKYGVLLPENGLEFYSRLFRVIERGRFIQFGNLIPVDMVFYLRDDGTIGSLSWSELYDYHTTQE